MSGFPIVVDVRQIRVLVVGGGRVAHRRVLALLAAGGHPTIVAPRLYAELGALVESHALPWQRRAYEAGEAARYTLVLSCTDDPAVNAAVAADAAAAGRLCGRADDADVSDFAVPAIVRRGELTVAIGTGGASPKLARHIRRRIEEVLPAGLADTTARLRALRAELRARWPEDEPRRRAFWAELFDDDMAEAALAGRLAEVQNRIDACLSRY